MFRFSYEKRKIIRHVQSGLPDTWLVFPGFCLHVMLQNKGFKQFHQACLFPLQVFIHVTKELEYAPRKFSFSLIQTHIFSLNIQRHSQSRPKLELKHWSVVSIIHIDHPYRLSNHPPAVSKKLPEMINNRISSLSSNEEIF